MTGDEDLCLTTRTRLWGVMTAASKSRWPPCRARRDRRPDRRGVSASAAPRRLRPVLRGCLAVEKWSGSWPLGSPPITSRSGSLRSELRDRTPPADISRFPLGLSDGGPRRGAVDCSGRLPPCGQWAWRRSCCSSTCSRQPGHRRHAPRRMLSPDWSLGSTSPGPWPDR